jgi:hypothetical protein
MLSKNSELVHTKKTIGQTTRIAHNIFEVSWHVCKYPNLNLIDRHPYISRKFSNENIKEDELNENENNYINTEEKQSKEAFSDSKDDFIPNEPSYFAADKNVISEIGNNFVSLQKDKFLKSSLKPVRNEAGVIKLAPLKLNNRHKKFKTKKNEPHYEIPSININNYQYKSKNNFPIIVVNICILRSYFSIIYYRYFL